MAWRYLLCVILLGCCSACGGGGGYHSVKVSGGGKHLKGWQRPYEVDGVSYTPLLDHQGFVQHGLASWYGKQFHGRKTSNGETYDMYAMTAAHKTLPLGVFVKVHNEANGREAVVRINDRGPFVAGRIIDLSYAAASKLGVVGPGTAPVTITALGYRKHDSGGQVSYSLPKTVRTGPFAVQVGAFTSRTNAERLRDRLTGVCGSADIQPAVVNGQRYYRVRGGHYTSLEQARQTQQMLEDSGFGHGFVVAID